MNHDERSMLYVTDGFTAYIHYVPANVVFKRDLKTGVESNEFSAIDVKFLIHAYNESEELRSQLLSEVATLRTVIEQLTLSKK